MVLLCQLSLFYASTDILVVYTTDMEFIDTHAHLDDTRFDSDRTEVIARAIKQGIRQVIVPAIHAAGWERLKQLCLQHKELSAAYGLHPMFMKQHRQQHVDELAKWLEHDNPVAVGECGLDFYIPEPDKTAQLWLFEAQLELASHYQLPVIIHARKSVEQVINTVCRFPTLTGVLHSFSGSQQQAERLIDMGFMLGFGGPVTYSKAHRLHALVKWLPLTALLLETDSPDQPDSTHHGERNEPAYIQEIVEVICSIREISKAQLAEVTSRNARQLFNLTAI